MQATDKKVETIRAKGIKVGIVVSRFNKAITDGLLDSALQALESCEVEEKDTQTVSVQGAAEVPFALMKLAETKKYDCLVALSCIIKGETAHFDSICKMVQEGVLRVSLDYKIPVGFGVVTAYTSNQAKARLQLGSEAVTAALELVTNSSL